MHLDEEQLQRLLHGQLPSRAARGARDHLAECADCREQFVTAERDEKEVLALLQQVDHPIPSIDPETLAARVRWTSPGLARWAAAILLFLGAAGAAYALPGSPLRHWVRSAVTWMGGREASPERPAATKAPHESAAGVAALPGKRFVIEFTSVEQGGRAKVALSDGQKVIVEAPAGTASFTSRAGRLIVTNTGSGGHYEIAIPRAAPRVEIRVAGNTVFVKDGARVQTGRAARIADGYLVPLSPPRP
jgi:hypothetical protein